MALEPAPNQMLRRWFQQSAWCVRTLAACSAASYECQSGSCFATAAAMSYGSESSHEQVKGPQQALAGLKKEAPTSCIFFLNKFAWLHVSP